ncbi:nectin-2-like [Haplochromis burtoni]|uniref:nectin-2-like n=1 Tax=Haplochromis burtoni TaxID=8153 RepID=UPI001C2DE954|nr:nectin-2-like [Haplochromis burtoni]
MICFSVKLVYVNIILTLTRSVDGSYCDSMSSLLLPMVVLQCTYVVEALQVIGGNVKVVQGGTAILPCHVTGTNDDLTQITWQRRTREKPHNDNFLTILPREGVQFVNGGDDRFKYIGNFNNKNGTLQLSNVALKDEGSYTCIFTLFPSGNQKTEIPLNLLGMIKFKILVPPFTNIKDNLPTLGTEEVLFATCTAAGSKPPAEVRWLTGALGDKVRTTTNSTQYDNDTTTTVSSLFGVPTREINGHQVQCVTLYLVSLLSACNTMHLLMQPIKQIKTNWNKLVAQVSFKYHQVLKADVSQIPKFQVSTLCDQSSLNQQQKKTKTMLHV